MSEIPEGVVPPPPDEQIVRDALAEVYRPEGVEIWMTAPHRSFGGRSATEMIHAGRSEEVLAEIERLTTGAFG